MLKSKPVKIKMILKQLDKERKGIEIKDAPKKHDAEVVMNDLETLKPESHLDPIGHYKKFNRVIAKDPFQFEPYKKFSRVNVTADSLPFEDYHRPAINIAKHKQKTTELNRLYKIPDNYKLKPKVNDLHYEYLGKDEKSFANDAMIRQSKETPEFLQTEKNRHATIDEMVNEFVKRPHKNDDDDVKPKELEAAKNKKIKRVKNVMSNAEYKEIKNNKFDDLVEDAKKNVNKPAPKKSSGLHTPRFAGSSIPVQSVSQSTPSSPKKFILTEEEEEIQSKTRSNLSAQKRLVPKSQSSDDEEEKVFDEEDYQIKTKAEQEKEKKEKAKALAEKKKESQDKSLSIAKSQIPLIIEELLYLSDTFTKEDGEIFSKIYLIKSANLSKASYNKLLEMSIPEDLKIEITVGMPITDLRKVFKNRFFPTSTSSSLATFS